MSRANKIFLIEMLCIVIIIQFLAFINFAETKTETSYETYTVSSLNYDVGYMLNGSGGAPHRSDYYLAALTNDNGEALGFSFVYKDWEALVVGEEITLKVKRTVLPSGAMSDNCDYYYNENRLFLYELEISQ